MKKSDLKSKKSSILKIRPRRVFSETFKREKVKEISAGEYSILSFCKLWNVANSTVYRWIYKYSPDHMKGTITVIQKESEAQKTIHLEAYIAEMERKLGQKQMQIDYLEKLIEIASKDYDVDLKKNIKVTL